MKSEGLIKFSKYMLMLLFISMLGWIWETIYLSLKYEQFMDRGFLTMPFCPIYGIAIMSVYFLIGTPKEGRGLLKGIHNKYALYITYFLMAMLIPTIIELFTGWFFDEVCGKMLWTYEGNWMNFRGYICPSVTLFWGVSLTLVMRYVFPHLKNLFFKIPDEIARGMAIFMLVLLSGDFGYNIYKSFKRN